MHLHLFLDLDLTLVNVFPLWQTLWIQQIADRLSVHPDDVYAKGATIWERGNLYTLPGHLRAMNINPEEEWAKNLQARFKEAVCKGAINYDDTAEFLDALERHGVTRSILTFGDREYQQMKVDGLSRPSGFFHGVHCTSAANEKARVLGDASSTQCVIFLDDSGNEHAKVATLAPTVYRIQIRRSDAIVPSSDAHHIVSDLAQALDVILSSTTLGG